MGCLKDPEGNMLCLTRDAELCVFTVEKPTSDRKPELISLDGAGGRSLKVRGRNHDYHEKGLARSDSSAA